MLQDIVGRSWAAAALLAAGGIFLSASPLAAQVQIFPGDAQWTVSPSFSAQDQANKNISGAVCPELSGRGCLAVNDSSNFAQAFSLGRNLIRPDAIIDLQVREPVPRDIDTIDAEGAAFDGEHYYVVGSHGQSFLRPAAARFLAFRIKANLAQPPGSPPTVERSERLREAVTQAIDTGLMRQNNVQLAQVEIEGVAVRRGRMFLGLRAPSLGGQAFLLSVKADAVFATGDLDLDIKTLALGDGIGIRDLTLSATGLLILGGPAANVAGAPSLFQFDLPSGPLKLLGVVTQPTDRNAETLMVLQEEPEFVRFLLMFDGVENGGPIEYFVSR